MARFEKQSPKGAKHDAAVKRGRRAPARGSSIEDTMFFPRLRRHAKWVFVFLALVFALGFVGFGVGAGGVGVGDIFRGAGGGEAQSVADARKRTVEEPKNVQAWRDLSIALQTEGADGAAGEAVEAIRSAIAVTPGDPDLYRDLAMGQLALATAKQIEAQTASVAAAYGAPAQTFPGLFQAQHANVLADPIGAAIAARASDTMRAAAAAALVAAAGVVTAYEGVVKLQPDDPNVQLELAGAAEQAGDLKAAITAYERFVALAPDDTQTPLVKKQLKLLRDAASG